LLSSISIWLNEERGSYSDQQKRDKGDGLRENKMGGATKNKKDEANKG
jgi:hypothetical protein